jgi:hypothetical protein
MFGPRLLAACLGVLVLASGAQASPSQVAAPKALHAFLLRADEELDTTFERTPAFAWNPVPGAVRYQFQLATSSTFRENAILYSANNLKTPVAAPQLTLPWIDDMLHARVRAILPNTTTPWSTRFAFDMHPPAPPTPLPSYSGMLRWTPVEGADGYQVWLYDIPRIKITTSYTNVLDEREFYTFHRSPAWTASVHWRIRALRRNIGAADNGLPAVSYGAWSPIYTSTNDPYHGGEIQLVGTLSDTFTDARTGAQGPNHRLMPGFVFTGDQTRDGESAELFRVYVFTDRGCLNRVFTSAVVGSPAYAPRPHGPLALPREADGLASARSSYLADGDEPQTDTLDGTVVQSNESLAPATPTTTVPVDSDTAAGSTPPGSAPATTTPAAGATSPTGSAPVDLWDTEPTGGYWWTVVAVEAAEPGRSSSNVAGAGANAKDTTIQIVAANNFAPGDVLTLGNPTNEETVTIKSISGSTIELATPLTKGHGPGEPLVRIGGNLRYRDLELPQDVCAHGRVARFAKNSEPSLTSAGEAFASGLSSGGKLVAASPNSPFYGNPLVAWTPALGAAMYQVQWSKTRAPFKPVLSGGAPGVLAWGTSVVLPLTPRTWYYRVRGFDYSLPTGAQEMSWSDPSRIVVAKPKFKIVGGGK